MKTITLAITYLILALSLSNCAFNPRFELPTPKGGSVDIPDGTALISFVDKNGVTHTMLPDGRALLECEFCTQGNEKECAASQSAKYCKGLINSTVINTSSSVRIFSHKNPYCITEIEGGKARQACYEF